MLIYLYYRAAFMHYPEQRQLDEEKKNEVKTMLQLGVKVKFLNDYIQEEGKILITTKDIHNVHQRMKKEHFGEKTEELLMDELNVLCKSKAFHYTPQLKFGSVYWFHQINVCL